MSPETYTGSQNTNVELTNTDSLGVVVDGDLYTVDDFGRGHRPDGKFLSHYEEAQIQAHVADIQGNAPGVDHGDTSEPSQPASQPQPQAIVLVGQSKDARSFARDYAENRVKEELAGQRGLKGVLTKLWKGGVFKQTYIDRYRLEALREIERTQDVTALDRTLSDEARARSAEMTIERFQRDEQELIETDAGEHREVQAEDSPLATGIKEIIARYVRGEVTDASIAEEQRQFLLRYRKEHGDASLGEGLAVTTNLIEIARAVQGRVEHQESLEHVLAEMRVITGEARNDARTEHHRTLLQRAFDKLEAKKGVDVVSVPIITPSTLIAGTALGYTLARWGSNSTVSTAAKFLLPVLGTGTVAGLNAWNRTKSERAQHTRDVALGGEFAHEDRKRQEMDRTRYESMSAVALMETLQRTTDPEVLENGGAAAVQAAMDALALIQTRVDMSNQQGIDLISFSDRASIGEERMALTLARIEARRSLEARLTPEIRAELGLDADASTADLIAERSRIAMDFVREDISAKDSAFRKIAAKHVAISAATGMIAGATAGMLIQEGIATFDGSRTSLLEALQGHMSNPVDGEQHQTLLAGLVNGNETVIHHDPSSTFDTYETHTTGEGTHGSIELSSDHTLQTQPDGTLNFVDANGHATVENLSIGSNGILTEASIDRLEAAGWSVEDVSYNEAIVTTSTAQLSGAEFIQNNSEATTAVTYGTWYNNDTSWSDRNELGLNWNGSGLTDHGYKMGITGMTSNGSFAGGESVDWKQAASEGRIYLALSASSDTVGQPILIPVGPDGVADIPYDSPAAQLFSQNGRVSFDGYWAQAVEVTGTNEDGSLQISSLATHIGENTSSFTDTIETTTYEHHAEYIITTAGYDTTIENVTEVPPVVPIVPFRNLEALRRRRDGYYGIDRPLTNAEISQRRVETSPRLLRDSAARLNPKEELSWYRRALKSIAPKGYIEDIEASLSASPELQVANPKLKAIVAIPVQAKTESDNIYRTLAAYAAQDPEALESAKILLHVNWKDSEMADATAREAIEKTKAEIERARVDFPQLTIATIESVWSQERIDRGEYGRGLIGHVSRKLYDTAMLSVENLMRSGALAADRDVLLVRNDADAQGIDRHYLQRMIDSSETHPETDIFTGAVRWDTARHKDLPGFAFVGNLLEIMNIAGHRPGVPGKKKTAGINTAVRMSTFAAVGGVGHDPFDTGAGSDDMVIGSRIYDVRSGTLEKSRLSRRPTRYGVANKGTSTVPYQRIVAGAGIDSKGDRIEATYLSDKPDVTVASTWNNYDRGGYSERSAGLGGNRRENLRDNPQEVLARIEKNITGIMGSWSITPAQLSTGLSVMIPLEIKGTPTYTISYHAGRPSFSFTSEGSEWLRNHLMRDSKGRIDHVGSRIRRQLYNELPKNGRRPLVNSQPRFV